MMATISNFTSFHTLFKMLNRKSYTMGTASLTLGKVWPNDLPNQNNLCDDDYTLFFSCNHVELIEFLMQQASFREHMSSAPIKEFNEAGERICSGVKSSHWRWNQQVH
jgi:hypothetical protein